MTDEPIDPVVLNALLSELTEARAEIERLRTELAGMVDLHADEVKRTQRVAANNHVLQARIDAVVEWHNDECLPCVEGRPCPTVRALTADVELTAGSVDATDPGPEDGPAPGQVSR